MTTIGTPNYTAPEILDQSGHSYEVDIWSLGVIIYTLIIGKPPFETSHVKTTYQRIKANSYTFPENVPISDAAKDLITRILSKDPAKRPTLEEITQHEFLTSNQIPKQLHESFLCCDPPVDFIQKLTALLQAVRVKKWVEDSDGLGYILSDNSSGFFFLDNTQIVVDSHKKNFYYFERKQRSATETFKHSF